MKLKDNLWVQPSGSGSSEKNPCNYWRLTMEGGLSKMGLVLLVMEFKMASCNFARQYASCIVCGLNILTAFWISLHNLLRKQLMAWLAGSSPLLSRVSKDSWYCSTVHNCLSFINSAKGSLKGCAPNLIEIATLYSLHPGHIPFLLLINIGATLRPFHSIV